MIAVDSGQLMVIDPCYLKYWKDKSDVEKPHKDLCYEVLSKKPGHFVQLNFDNSLNAAVVSRTGSDGFYQVIGECDDHNRLTKISVILDSDEWDKIKDIIKTQEVVDS